MHQWYMDQIPNMDDKVKAHFQAMITISDLDVPLITAAFGLSFVETKQLQAIYRNFGVADNKEYYNALAKAANVDTVAKICVEYYQTLRDVIKAKLEGNSNNQHASLAKRLTFLLNITAQRKMVDRKTIRYYTEADRKKLIQLDQKLEQLINNTKGGKEND